MNSPKRFWVIEGYKGLDRFYRKKVPYGVLTEPKGVTRLLQRLASKHLDEGQIIAASIKTNAKGYHGLLEPMTSTGKGNRGTVSVGVNPYYTASIWTADELRDKQLDTKHS